MCHNSKRVDPVHVEVWRFLQPSTSPLVLNRVNGGVPCVPFPWWTFLLSTIRANALSYWTAAAPQEVSGLASLWSAAIRWQRIDYESFTVILQSNTSSKCRLFFSIVIRAIAAAALRGSGETKPQKLKIDQALWAGAVTRTCALPWGCRLPFTVQLPQALRTTPPQLCLCPKHNRAYKGNEI